MVEAAVIVPILVVAAILIVAFALYYYSKRHNRGTGVTTGRIASQSTSSRAPRYDYDAAQRNLDRWNAKAERLLSDPPVLPRDALLNYDDLQTDIDSWNAKTERLLADAPELPRDALYDPDDPFYQNL